MYIWYSCHYVTDTWCVYRTCRPIEYFGFCGYEDSVEIPTGFSVERGWLLGLKSNPNGCTEFLSIYYRIDKHVCWAVKCDFTALCYADAERGITMEYMYLAEFCHPSVDRRPWMRSADSGKLHVPRAQQMQ